MPQVLVEENQRMSLRIPAKDKALLMRAASLQQVNLTEFVLRASVQAAQAAIERAERLLCPSGTVCVCLNCWSNHPCRIPGCGLAHRHCPMSRTAYAPQIAHQRAVVRPAARRGLAGRVIPLQWSG